MHVGVSKQAWFSTFGDIAAFRPGGRLTGFQNLRLLFSVDVQRLKHVVYSKTAFMKQRHFAVPLCLVHYAKGSFAQNSLLSVCPHPEAHTRLTTRRCYNVLEVSTVALVAPVAVLQGYARLQHAPSSKG